MECFLPVIGISLGVWFYGICVLLLQIYHGWGMECIFYMKVSYRIGSTICPMATDKSKIPLEQKWGVTRQDLSPTRCTVKSRRTSSDNFTSIIRACLLPQYSSRWFTPALLRHGRSNCNYRSLTSLNQRRFPRFHTVRFG